MIIGPYMCVKNRITGRHLKDIQRMTNVCTGEILPAIFIWITYTQLYDISNISLLHMKAITQEIWLNVYT